MIGKKSCIFFASGLLLLGAAAAGTMLNAAPARRCVFSFAQPDGSRFSGYICGDEFWHYKKAANGRAIAQGSDGWWYYADYSADGKLIISSTKVGTVSLQSANTASVPSNLPAVSPRRKIFNERLSQRRALASGNGSIAPAKASALPASKHGIIILAEFKDVPFTYKRANFVNMLTQNGYSYNGATGSAVDYFNAQFGGSVDFSFDVSEIVKLPQNVEYYGGNDSDGNDRNPEQMIIDACKGAAENGVDFSLYDDDNDGYVDNVFVFFSGGDEADGAGDNCIWSHAYYIESGAGKKLELNGKRIDSYACTAELTPEFVEYGGAYAATGKYVLAGIGTFCHEYSHTFGLPDLYDTDYQKSGGQSEALWTSTGLMDGGNMNNDGNTPPYYNAIEREYLSIGEALTLSEGTHTLEPIWKDGKYYRIDTDTAGEYFLIECRNNNSLWDKYIGGSGMLVYHIDKSRNSAGKSDSYGMTLTAYQRWEHYNEVNCRPDRQCADLVEADPNVAKQAHKGTTFSPTATQTKKIFFPSGNYNTLGPSNGLKALDGTSCGIQIYGIAVNNDGSVSFAVSTPKEMSASVEKTVFQSAAILEISTENVEGKISVKYGVSGKQLSSELEAEPVEDGKYIVKLSGLNPKIAYKAEIYASAEGAQTLIGSTSFTTKATSGAHPLIVVNVDGRNDDGSFSTGAKLPLVVNNASAAVQTEWYFDGEKLDEESSIFLTVEKSGTLEAVLTFSGGVQKRIYKKIVMK